MEKRIEQLIETLPPVHVPERLEMRIISHIRMRQVRQARIAFFSSSALAIGSVVGVVSSVRYFIASAYASGFGDYLSLMLSENAGLMKYWKEFSLTLVESIPLIALAAVLFAVCAFLWSGIRAAKCARTALIAYN
jgi:hypothetical protein